MNIFEASRNGDINRINELLDSGIYVNSKHPQDNSTPLMWATRYTNTESNIETVKLLLDRGADVNIQTKDGYTALIWATRYSNTTSTIETVKLLLDRGANVNSQTNNGNTALMLASRNSNTDSNIETVKLLLDRGAEVNLQTKDGHTALTLVSAYSNTDSNIETVKLLLDRGADINFKTNDGGTALILASLYSNTDSNIETVKLLLDRGADPFDKNNDGETIPDLCPTNECKQIIYKAIWNKLYQTDKKLARQYSQSGNGNFPALPKDVWELILLNKRQQQLCRDLSSNKNREVLWYFAEMLNIPLNERMTKAQLCGLIARYLAYGQYEDEKRGAFVSKRANEDRRKIIEVAQRFGIDTNRPLKQILEDISKLIM